MQDILSLLDLNAEFDWKRRLWFEIGKAQAETTLRDCKNDCLLPFFRSCVQEGFAKDILKVLDQGKRSLQTRGSPRNYQLRLEIRGRGLLELFRGTRKQT